MGQRGIRIIHVTVPEAVRSSLKHLHRWGTSPVGNSVRYGTQINLTDTKNRTMAEFKDVLIGKIREIMGPCRFSGVWSVMLPKGGYHVLHNHPKGWFSGVTWVSVPDNTTGRLKIMDWEIIPEVGKVVLFHSTVPHEVTVYQGPGHRISLAFDLEELCDTSSTP